MERQYFSRKWDNAPMPHSIFFTRAGHAIHGSYVVGRLGTPASHGCVRISPANAATLYAVVRAEGLANTHVVIAGSEQKRVAKGPRIARQPLKRRPVDDGYYGGVYDGGLPYRVEPFETYPYETYPYEAYPDEIDGSYFGE